MLYWMGFEDFKSEEVLRLGYEKHSCSSVGLHIRSWMCRRFLRRAKACGSAWVYVEQDVRCHRIQS